ncbi:sugar ABC transporter permease [Bosea caraganae]|uniref:Sugar ABC transporter permease n=1 Tax=Bosea caraganae TaxID=2763117 RepID=A0A370KYF6_9HYPH|nr:sugar ABC transporter permease [Bosea caraganae]RDJ19976.1 sugar ABC transporter permease [Bosea caraganae]RDJ23915.1 sugar ABC transporter permease [Bosea caraganae]
MATSSTSSRAYPRERSLWLFVLPSALVVLGVQLYPVAYAVWLSFFDYHVGQPQAQFVGLENYIALLGQGRVWASLRTTVILVACSLAIEFVLGLLLALGLYKLTRGARIFSTLIFVPYLITPVVAALFLRWIFAARWGLADAVIASFDVFPPDWLGSPIWAFVTIITADVWQFTPFVMLILYAGLQGIDESLLEAGRIDGASGARLVWHIILPALRPQILFVLAIRLMDSFRTFDSIYVLTGGGPGTATETLTMYTYAMAFKQLDLGRASTLGVLTMLIVTGLTLMIISLMYRREKGAF